MDKSTLTGIILAVVGILAGLVLEGGRLGQILQPTAAMIVIGGTIGAVMVQFPLPTVLRAGKSLSQVFVEKANGSDKLVKTLVDFAQKARKDGIVSLDADLPNIQEGFLKKSLMLAVDGTEPEELRKMMEIDLDVVAEDEEKISQVFEAAGGFAPTIGIIGAILGLIQVMQHLENIDEVGKGIAVAFVATIYGVGSANVFFLPAAGKLKIRHRKEQLLREMAVEGVVSILEGINPRMLETKLRGFFADQPGRSPEAAKS